MTTLNMGLKPAESSPAKSSPAKSSSAKSSSAKSSARRDAANGGVQGPMPQQTAFGSHGYDVYPQTFVRLIGCHPSNTAKSEYDAAPSLQRTAA